MYGGLFTDRSGPARRVTAEELRAAGALEWSGSGGEDLVRHTRLPS